MSTAFATQRPPVVTPSHGDMSTAFATLIPGGERVSGDRSIGGNGRYRVYQVIGLILGALFVAVGLAAILGGGGPVIGVIGLVGGVAVIAVSIVMMVRS